METFERLLTLLTLLQRQATWTSEELAERLGVTTRTVRRDVTKLRDLGYVIDAEAGRYGGYRLLGGQAMPPLALADDEAVAVAVALRGLATSNVSGVDDAAITALAKLEQVLPGRLRERLSALGGAIESIGGPGPDTVDADTLVALAHACRSAERVRIAYTDARGTPSRRDLEPHRLVQAHRRWYLVAFDRGRDDWRTLRVDRIGEVAPQGRRSEPRPAPDVAALVGEGITTAPYRWQATIRLHCSLATARAAIAPSVGHVHEVDGEVHLRIGADHLGWMARYLIGMVERFDIIDPPELRDALADLGRELVTTFGDAGA